MKLDFMILAGHAEQQGALLNILNGGWDTLTVNSPLTPEQLQGLPEGHDCAGLLTGALVIRLLFHHTETDREHTFRVAIVDEDGGKIGQFDGQMTVPRNPDTPIGWDQNFPIIIPLPNIVLPRFGSYTISLLVDDAHVTDKPFRLIKGYED